MATAMALTLEYLLGVPPNSRVEWRRGKKPVRIYIQLSRDYLECDYQVCLNMSLQLLFHSFNKARHSSDTPLQL